MALFRGYSRTYRIAELYERFFYADVWESARRRSVQAPLASEACLVAPLTVLALAATAMIVFLYLKPVRFVSSLLYDRVFLFLLAHVLPIVAFPFLVEGWLHRWLGKQSRL